MAGCTHHTCDMPINSGHKIHETVYLPHTIHFPTVWITCIFATINKFHLMFGVCFSFLQSLFWPFGICREVLIIGMTHSDVGRDSSIHKLMTRFYTCVRHDSSIHDETWHIHMCDITYTHTWHDSSILETWLIHTWDMIRTHSDMRQESFTYETRHMQHAHPFDARLLDV